MAEFLGLCFFALSLLLPVRLGTSSPAAPACCFKAGSGAPTRNFIGPLGAFFAELLVPQLFGLAAILVPIVLGFAGWKLFWCRPVEAPYTKVAGLMLMLASMTTLHALVFGTLTYAGEAVRAGGAAGELGAAFLTATLNRTGAYIVCGTALFVSVILATQFSFAASL